VTAWTGMTVYPKIGSSYSQWVRVNFIFTFYSTILWLPDLFDWVIAMQCQMSNFSVISWQEQVTFYEMIMVSALYMY
jgi:hypothetical protein